MSRCNLHTNYLFGFFIPVSPELLAVFIHLTTGNLQQPDIQPLTVANEVHISIYRYTAFPPISWQGRPKIFTHVKFINLLLDLTLYAYMHLLRLKLSTIYMQACYNWQNSFVF